MKKTKWHSIGISCLLIILLLPNIGQAENIELRVTVSMANIRSKPTTLSEVLTQVTKGTVLNSDLREENWYRVILPPDDEGIERIGYIHNSIVEEVETPKEPGKETPEEPVKEAPKIIEKAEDVIEKAEEPAAIIEYFEPTEVKTESSSSGFFKKFSLKLSGGVGFFLDGGGDLEKLRLETKDYITALGNPPASTNEFNGHSLSIPEGVSSHESKFNWDPFSINSHFLVGLYYGISNNWDAGISFGIFKAKNDNIHYSHSSLLVSDEEWGTMAEIDTTAYTEDYELSATPVFVNLSYSPNPSNSPGKIFPEFSIGAGPVFARIERNFVQDRNYNAAWTSPVYGEGWQHEWRNTTINGIWKATTLGALISGGVGWNVTRWMTISLHGFVFLASSKNWKGSEEGNWEWGLQRYDEELGEIVEDESDGGDWNYGPDAPLSYYTHENGLSHPMMFIRKDPPENGYPPSNNKNDVGIGLTFTFPIGGGIAQPPGKIEERPRVPDKKGGEEAGQEPLRSQTRPRLQGRVTGESEDGRCKISADFYLEIKKGDKTRGKAFESAGAGTPTDEPTDVYIAADETALGKITWIPEGTQTYPGNLEFYWEEWRQGEWHKKKIKDDDKPEDSKITIIVNRSRYYNNKKDEFGKYIFPITTKDSFSKPKNVIKTVREKLKGIEEGAKEGGIEFRFTYPGSPQTTKLKGTAKWTTEDCGSCETWAIFDVHWVKEPTLKEINKEEDLSKPKPSQLVRNAMMQNEGEIRSSYSAKDGTAHVVYPIRYVWGVEEMKPCCDLNVYPEVIQFGRAVYESDNESKKWLNMAYPWVLDINADYKKALETKIKKKKGKRKLQFDPTFTNKPGDPLFCKKYASTNVDRQENIKAISHWDAPGMPDVRFRQLLYLKGEHVFRQQFISFLICRPTKGRKIYEKHLEEIKVLEAVIYNVTWTFKADFDPENPMARIVGPKVDVVDKKDMKCLTLGVILNANGLTEAFKDPTRQAIPSHSEDHERYKSDMENFKEIRPKIERN
ncbi:MAG: SH3 domain-containing protein [Candidatus Hodarchaeota archaeon]